MEILLKREWIIDDLITLRKSWVVFAPDDLAKILPEKSVILAIKRGKKIKEAWFPFTINDVYDLPKDERIIENAIKRKSELDAVWFDDAYVANMEDIPMNQEDIRLLIKHTKKLKDNHFGRFQGMKEL